jgi:tetratricopeptide (TPR) repeat protein
MRWHALFILIVSLLALGTALADETTTSMQTDDKSAHSLFAEANAFYKQNKYEEALTLYEQLLVQGIVDPVLYYNTGNAYVQLHRPGSAVLMYERALRLDPRDADAHENLAEIAPRINNPRVFILLRPLHRVKEAFTLNEFTLALELTYLLFVTTMLGIFLTRRAAWLRLWKRAARISALLLLCVACFFGIKLHETFSVREAIVMEEETYARSGPSASFSPILELPAGTKVMLVEESEQRLLPGALEAYYVDPSMRPVEKPGQNWARIRLRSGQSGYLPTSAFEII